MKARITRQPSYRCSPGGAVVETFPFGAVVTGQVARWAVDDGAAIHLYDPREETKVVAPPEVKRGRPRKAK